MRKFLFIITIYIITAKDKKKKKTEERAEVNDRENC